MTLHPCFLGIDIAKHHLDLFDTVAGQGWRIANDQASIAALLSTRDPAEVFIAFEATGPYDQRLCRALEAAGFSFRRINPARARDFARATGLLAKTDALDARMLAAMAQSLALLPEAPADPARLALAGLHRRRDQLVEARAAERVRRAEGRDPGGSIARLLAFLDEEILRVEAELAAALRANATLAALETLLRSAPGIGPVAAVTLITLMPELGQRSAKTIAALAGLAPFNDDSGKRHGQRAIAGGRRRVRRALYMAALGAIRCCPRFRRFYDAILARRAAPKIAIIAVARKLLVTLNAMLKTNSVFQS